MTHGALTHEEDATNFHDNEQDLNITATTVRQLEVPIGTLLIAF